jgi:hypothetical protein
LKPWAVLQGIQRCHHRDDVIAMAKAINGFLKDNPAATFKA